MRTGTKLLTLIVVLCAALGASPAALAADGTVTASKSVAPADILCGGAATVTVTLNAQTGLAGNPADIELVLDRSGSMGGTPLVDMKNAANAFVDLIDQASDGNLDGVIANGSRVGVVSFADGASVDVPLGTNATAVKTAVNALGAGGGTNHEAAITTGQAQLAGSSPSSLKKMIIFTDGVTTVGGSAQPEATAARAAGTEIFAIGLGSVNVAQLNGWATDPDLGHVFTAPSSGDLAAIFNAIGAAITVPAATNVSLVDTVSSRFSVSGASVTKGAVAQVGNVLTWTIPSLGTEQVTLTYTITHDPVQAGGTLPVSASTTYSDAEGKSVVVPNPSVRVHLCAKTIDLTPPTAVHELGTPGQTHAVVATVLDDFGDPVGAIPVSFDVLSGPNAAAPNGLAPTNGSGRAGYSYTAVQGLAGLGTDTIEACFVNGAGQKVCDTATATWVDTTPPAPGCAETVNPAGGTIPGEGLPHGGQNPDGFFVLTATDAVDPDPELWIRDSADASVNFGPFASGTTIKLVQAPGATQSVSPGTGAIDFKVRLKGDARIFAVDSSGNEGGPASCNVPPAH